MFYKEEVVIMECSIEFLNNGYNGNIIMTEEHKRKLIINHAYIVDNIRYEDIRNQLIQEGTLIGDDDEFILSNKINSDKMRKFIIDILPRRPDKHFYSFVKCLMVKELYFVHHELVSNLLANDNRVKNHSSLIICT